MLFMLTQLQFFLCNIIFYITEKSGEKPGCCIWLIKNNIQFYSIPLNDGAAPTNLAILYLRKTSCSLPQSLHLSRTRPEMFRYFGLIASSSAMHSITFPQSHENNCFTTEYSLVSMLIRIS
jgi:hypothetical protein